MTGLRDSIISSEKSGYEIKIMIVTTFDYRHMFTTAHVPFPFYLAWAAMTVKPNNLSKSQSETRPNQIVIWDALAVWHPPTSCHASSHEYRAVKVLDCWWLSSVLTNGYLFLWRPFSFFFGRERDGTPLFQIPSHLKKFRESIFFKFDQIYITK